MVGKYIYIVVRSNIAVIKPVSSLIFFSTAYCFQMTWRYLKNVIVLCSMKAVFSCHVLSQKKKLSQPLKYKKTGLILFHTSLLYKLSPRFRSRFAFSLGLPFPYLERAGICRRMRTIGKAKKLLLVLRMHCGYKNKKQEKSNHKFHDILELIFSPF